VSKEIKALGPRYGIARVHKQRCTEKNCPERTRMALLIPCLDIEEDASPGIAAVVLCGTHLESSLLILGAEERKLRS
jgi:hypothetical protein